MAQDVHYTDREMLGRCEMDVILDMLGAELAHELMHTVSVLRYLTASSAQRSAKLQELEQSEIARLLRLIGHLRRLSSPPRTRELIEVLPLLRHCAEELARDETAPAGAIRMEIHEPLWVSANRPLLCLLFRQLMWQSLSSAVSTHQILVTDAVVSEGRHAVSRELIFWTDGSHMDGAALPQLFNPWPQSPPESRFSRLATALRAARSLGWDLSCKQGRAQDELRLLIPQNSIEPGPLL